MFNGPSSVNVPRTHLITYWGEGRPLWQYSLREQGYLAQLCLVESGFGKNETEPNYTKLLMYNVLTLLDPRFWIPVCPGGGHKVPGLEKVSQTPSRHHPTPPRHHQKPPDTSQTPPRHPQTTSRHPTDTTQTPPVTPRQHPDTTTIQPSSTWPCRHPSDTP